MIRIATNIFNSPENTGPGNFGRRLHAALNPLGVELISEHFISQADAYLGNAFYDGVALEYDIPSILRVDGAGRAGEERNRVEHAHANVDICIYQSEHSAKLLQWIFDVVPEVSHVIHNGVAINSSWGCKDIRQTGIRLLSICNNWDEARYKLFMDMYEYIKG